MTEVYKENPHPGLRVCEKGECDNLGSIGGVEDDIIGDEEENT